jgi:nitrogen regulatory protein P-II 1
MCTYIVNYIQARMLKKVEAIVRIERMPHIKERLEEIGIYGFAVSNIQTWRYETTPTLPRFKGKPDIYDLVDKKKVDIIISEDLVDSIIDAIKEQARTGGTNGQIGDGIIAVSSVEQFSSVANLSNESH